MKFIKFLSLGFLLLSACNNPQQQAIPPLVHINAVPNQLSLLSDTSLSVTLLTTPPNGLLYIILASGNKVLKVANIDGRLKKGYSIKLNYPFKNHQHYALYAVGEDPGREYYDMCAYDFMIRPETKSIILLRRARDPAKKQLLM